VYFLSGHLSLPIGGVFVFTPVGFPVENFPACRLTQQRGCVDRQAAASRVRVNVPAVNRRVRGATIGGRLWQRRGLFLSAVGVVR